MEKSKVGVVALALALGSSASAELSVMERVDVQNRIGKLNSMQSLVDGLEASQNQAEYEYKLNNIRNILKNLTKEEQKKLTQGAIRCAEGQ